VQQEEQPSPAQCVEKNTLLSIIKESSEQTFYFGKTTWCQSAVSHIMSPNGNIISTHMYKSPEQCLPSTWLPSSHSSPSFKIPLQSKIAQARLG